DSNSQDDPVDTLPASPRYHGPRSARATRKLWSAVLSEYRPVGCWCGLPRSRPRRAAVGPLDKHHLDLLPYSTASSVVRSSDANARIDVAPGLSGFDNWACQDTRKLRKTTPREPEAALA